MKTKINYISGQKINGVTYIKDVSPHIDPKTKMKFRRALFICSFCGMEFETNIASIKRGLTKSCCYKGRTTYGLHKHLLYGIWAGIKDRCYNENYEKHKNYGGRGISVCSEWINNFKTFYDWCMENGYKKGLTIDRRNNDGNYTPKNCRFVNWHIQITNRRMMKNNTSGFTGVHWCKNRNKWRSKITINGKRIHLGLFKKITDAIKSRNNYIIKQNLTEYKIQN